MVVSDRPNDTLREEEEVSTSLPSQHPVFPYTVLLCVSEQQEAIVHVTRAESSPLLCACSTGIAVFHALGAEEQD